MKSILASAMVFSCAVFGPVHAQPYPNHPVRLIVPYPPGGITDVLARTIAQRVSIDWGQQMIVYHEVRRIIRLSPIARL